jgi:hypothetical protein
MSATTVAGTTRGVVPPPSPYVGLVPFGERDAAFFFGRSQEVAIVRANLCSSRLTVVYGPSGVGKSSLIMAGVVQGLRAVPHVDGDGRPSTVCVLRRWVDDPSHALMAACTRAFHEGADGVPLALPGDDLLDNLHAWTERAGPLLVVLDQFEEYFQYHPAPGGGEQLSGFDADLARIVNDPDLEVNVLLSIREDAWPKLDRYEGHMPLVFANYLRIDHLDETAAREAIELPILAWNRLLPAGAERYTIEPALVGTIIAAASGNEMLPAGEETVPSGRLAGDRIEAPFLQLLLGRLWDATVSDGGHALTVQRLAALGGPALIVAGHMREAIGQLSTAEQEVASDCFRFLVSTDRTKIMQRAADLAVWTKRSEAQVVGVLEQLCSGERGRLLRAVAPAAGEADGAGYELFHDVLAVPVLAWRREFEAQRARRAARRRLIRVAAVLGTLAAVFAAISIWALAEQHRAVVAQHQAVAAQHQADTLYHEQQAVTRGLQRQLVELRARRAAVLLVNARQVSNVAGLSARNLALLAATQSLRGQRGRLDRSIATLRSANRATRAAIAALNAENTRLAARISRLDKTYAALANRLASIQAAHTVLSTEHGIIAGQAASVQRDLTSTNGRVDHLRYLATQLGTYLLVSPVRQHKVTPRAYPTGPPTVAQLFPIAGGPPGQDALRRQVALLQQQLTRLLQLKLRLAGEARWLRRDNLILARERGLLHSEVARLGRTRFALEAQALKLERSLLAAQAQRSALQATLAGRTARNHRQSNAVATATAANATLQAAIDRTIDSIGTLQSKLHDARDAAGIVLNEVNNGEGRLIAGAQSSSTAPVLSGMLAVAAFHLTPYPKIDPAHPGVYNALWTALSKLAPATATTLIAPVPGRSGLIGTAAPATLASRICGLISGRTAGVPWGSYFSARALYPQKPSNPCG